MTTAKLSAFPFADPQNFLFGDQSSHASYLRSYLTGLNVSTVIREEEYFDRDFLSEYSSFYSRSAADIKSFCSRLHFFSLLVTQDLLEMAIAGNTTAISKLQKHYLGFCVIRPLEKTPYGKTVFRWYPENQLDTPRVVKPSRQYTVHICNIELKVSGLAWQQQDGGVARCATVALWSLLHSSAFHDYYSIPTTVEVTERAHRTASLGSRIFPSDGLSKAQIAEAIKESKLAPTILNGDVAYDGNIYFIKDRFNSYAAALLRSGYPVLLFGRLGSLGFHATCLVGFREASPTAPRPGEANLQDSNVEFYYIHDDNIGPSARFKLHTDSNGYIFLRRDSSYGNPTDPHMIYDDFIPTSMIFATHDEMRTPLSDIFSSGANLAISLASIDNIVNGSSTLGFTSTSKILKCSDYLSTEIGEILKNSPTILAKTRLDIYNNAPKMGLHIGIARIGVGSSLKIDLVYDATGGHINSRILYHVVYDNSIDNLLSVYYSAAASNSIFAALGTRIEAF